MNSHLATDRTGDIFHIELLDRSILDPSCIQMISLEICELATQECNPKILIDFKNVQQLSSAGLGALIKISQAIRDRDGQLRLIGIKPQIYKIFAITHLDSMFQIYDDITNARNSFTSLPGR